MDKRIRENASFYALGLIATLIAVLGICANSIYAKAGGYAIAFGCVVVALLCGFFIYAISPNLAKTRTKGMIALSCILVFLYTIIFIVVDIGKTSIYKYENIDGNIVSKLSGFGNVVFIFEVLCIIATFLLVLRMILNLFDKEIKFYEKLLGTPSLRYKERKEIVLELPEKDTDKLLSSAKRAIDFDPKLRKAIEESVLVEEDNVSVSVESDENHITKKSEREYIEPIHDIVKEPEFHVEESTENSDDIVVESTNIEDGNSESDILEESTEPIFEDNLKDNEQHEESVVEVNEEIAADSSLSQSEDSQAVNERELFGDSTDVGEINEYEINEDFRNTNLIHHITEQVDSDDDDIYSDFNYDDDDK